METTYDNLEIDFPEEGIARVTLNRPERLNAMTYGLVNDLHGALDAVDNDHAIRAVILTGSGRGFCAGLDLTGFGKIPGTEEFGEQQQGMAVQQYIAELVHHMRDVRQPIIAGVNGAAAGWRIRVSLRKRCPLLRCFCEIWNRLRSARNFWLRYWS